MRHATPPVALHRTDSHLSMACATPGEFITLGINEADDLEAVIAYLRRDVRVSKVALWGRSMGAATAVLYAQRDPSVAALVLDSSFSRCGSRLGLQQHPSSTHTPLPRHLTNVSRQMRRKMSAGDEPRLEQIPNQHSSSVEARSCTHHLGSQASGRYACCVLTHCWCVALL